MTPCIAMLSLMLAFYFMYLWTAEPTKWVVAQFETTAGISCGALMIGAATAVQQGRPWSLTLTAAGTWLFASFVMTNAITYMVYSYDAKIQPMNEARVWTLTLLALPCAGGWVGALMGQWLKPAAMIGRSNFWLRLATWTIAFLQFIFWGWVSARFVGNL